MIVKIEYEDSKHIYKIPIEVFIKELKLKKDDVDKAIVRIITRDKNR